MMKDKVLAIISDCIHSADAHGRCGSKNHIFVAQMESIASHFKKTIICCPFTENREHQPTTSYTNPSIEFIKLRNVGGDSIRDKITVFLQIPFWIRSFRKVKHVDFVYQRFPNNLNIPGFFYFKRKSLKRFATYTGTWRNYADEPATYRFQKWLLKLRFNGPVFIYGEDVRYPNVFSTFSPSYSRKVWLEQEPSMAEKLTKQSVIQHPVFVTVGSFVSYKNQQHILDTFKILHQKNYPFTLYLVGDGPLANAYRRFINANELADCIFMTGTKSSGQLQQIYKQANFVVQASLVEGFGKVPVEGYFFGAIPILHNTGMAGVITGFGQRGFLFEATKKNDLLNLLEALYTKHYNFPAMIAQGREFVEKLTLENWSAQMISEVEKFYYA